MWLDLQKLALLPMTGSSFFAINKRYINTLTIFTAKLKYCSLGGLLLLAVFLQPYDGPYEWSGSLMELWWEGRGLCVTVKFSGIELGPLLSLHYHFSWLWTLCGPYQGLFHLFIFIWHFFMNPLPAICPLTSLPLLSSPYATIWEPTSEKNYLKWQETCFLVRGWF